MTPFESRPWWDVMWCRRVCVQLSKAWAVVDGWPFMRACYIRVSTVLLKCTAAGKSQRWLRLPTCEDIQFNSKFAYLWIFGGVNNLLIWKLTHLKKKSHFGIIWCHLWCQATALNWSEELHLVKSHRAFLLSRGIDMQFQPFVWRSITRRFSLFATGFIPAMFTVKAHKPQICAILRG